jgi:hypothetical protein
MPTARLLSLVLAAVAAAAAFDDARAGALRAARATVTGLDVSPPWISLRGGTLPPRTTVSFDLVRPGTAVFSLTKVAPVCSRVGAFRVRGRAGRNRFLFPGRIDRRLLPPGTYRLTAAGPRGRVVRTAIVIAASLDGPGARARALRRDVCGRTAGRAVANPRPRGAVLGARFGESQEEARALRPFVVACLALAIALLGVAALPRRATPGPRSAELLIAGRPALALAGGLALAAGTALYVASMF